MALVYVAILLLVFSSIATLAQSGSVEIFKSGDFASMPKVMDIPPQKAHGLLAFVLIALFARFAPLRDYFPMHFVLFSFETSFNYYSTNFTEVIIYKELMPNSLKS